MGASLLRSERTFTGAKAVTFLFLRRIIPVAIFAIVCAVNFELLAVKNTGAFGAAESRGRGLCGEAIRALLTRLCVGAPWLTLPIPASAFVAPGSLGATFAGV